MSIILLMSTSDLRFEADLFDGGGHPVEMRTWPDVGNPSEIDYLLMVSDEARQGALRLAEEEGQTCQYQDRNS